MDLEPGIRSLIEKSAAKFGIALRHIESGEEVSIHADQYFPMASVFKIPILVEACFRLAEGQIKPSDRWALKDSEKNFPSGVLVFFDQGLAPTLKDLLMLMIIISDNTATDILLDRFGKQAVVGRMRSLGLNDIHITMTVRELFSEIMPDTNPNKPILELLRMLRGAGENPELSPAGRVTSLTPANNVSTPRDMTHLLQLIYDGRAPNREWSDFALDILLRQQLNDRIPRFLPNGTPVAHKTGTIRGICNDAGIIYVNDNSHIILSEFAIWEPSKDPRLARQGAFEIENIMGEIALAAYQAFS